MDCKEFKDLTLAPERLRMRQRMLLNEHLASCSACAVAYEADRWLDSLVRESLLSEPLHTDSIEANILRRIRTERRWYQRRQWLAWALVPVTAVVLFFAISERRTPKAPTIYSDAIEDHTQEVVEHSPLEWTNDPAKVKLLLTSWTSNPRIADDLAPANFHLDRVRVCELMGRTYLHLVYSNGAQEVSVFVRKRDGERLEGRPQVTAGRRDVHVSTQHGVEVAGFQSDLLTVLYVGDPTKTHITEMAAQSAAGM